MLVGTGDAKSENALQGNDAVEVVNAAGRGPFVIVCEHASNAIPAELNALGLDNAAAHSHIAWDPGAREVAVLLAKHLDAPLIAQRYSRLVYDCNRAADAPSAIPETSETYTIPGNAQLSREECLARAERYYTPFHDMVGTVLDARLTAEQPSVLITVHSFTPVFHGVKRAVELGILHDTDTRFADALLDQALAHKDMQVERNAPYSATDGVTFTLSEHALPRAMLNVMLEIRNDLIRDQSGQETMAQRLASYIQGAYHAIVGKEGDGANA